ncbi:ribbon-helix-helix protein, CopG family [Actinopolymorpha alba]|uniref:ribbon-helix-helix protein, CopG family n=1 Tax=Actinopolymorpha alba TaxID=533267 RepID=UPI0003677A62|nr:ribbon-helix-helix protein, CopG family [Actinopolymorpha alba]
MVDDDCRSRGRPEVGPTIQVRIPSDQLEIIDDYAEVQDISRAEAIRRLLTAGLKTTATWHTRWVRSQLGGPQAV